MKLALLLLPVLDEPNEQNSTNGFDAAPKKPTKRKRSHSYTRRCNGMTPTEFDAHCRALAKDEIIKTLKLAEQIENDWGKA
jgi:hypothetical protein